MAAYEHLISDGLAEAHHGLATYVSRHLPKPQNRLQAVRLQWQPRQRRPFALGFSHRDHEADS